MKSKKGMEAKKEIIKKILVRRRLFAKLAEDTNMVMGNLLNVQEMYLQLLKELQVLHIIKILISPEKLIWQKERTRFFWEIDCQRADDLFFKNNFRMNRATFDKLCELLHELKKSDTNMREAIPLEKRVAIGLYALGSSAEYRTIGNMFGVGKSTVCEILLSFCDVVWRVLAPLYLNNFPLTSEKVMGITKEFEALGFPQCIGALDGCHIEIHPSQEDATDYYNYKGWYSIVLLALVDARCRFIYVSCGSPRRCNDSQIFEGSSLKQQLDQSSLLHDLSKNISGVNVPLLVIGDSAFRLSDKLMKPYPFQVSQSHQQKSFNYALSKSRRVVENAFGHLKARFRRIGKGIDNAIRNTNVIILSCCALHNFLNENNDTVNEKWLHTLEAMEANRYYPEHIASLTDQSSKQNPEIIRQAISNYLSVDVDGIHGDDDNEAAGMGDDGDEAACMGDDGEESASIGDDGDEAVGMGDDDDEAAGIGDDDGGEILHVLIDELMS